MTRMMTLIGLLSVTQAANPAAVVAGSPAPGGGARWAVIVGVEEYQSKSIEPFGGAVTDAKAIREVLIRQAEFPPDQVTLLVSDGDVKPTAGAILGRLDEITAAARPEDLLLFFFEGHSAPVDGQRHLLTYETDIGSPGRLKATSLRASALLARLEATRVGNRVLMVDAWRNDPTRPGAPNLSDGAFGSGFTIEPNRKPGVRAVFASCSKGQRAYQSSETGRGFFSFFIERGLLGEAAMFGKVTLSSLVSYLNETVAPAVRKETKQSQTPYGNVDGGSLSLLVVK